MQLPSFFRKYGEPEDPLFTDIPESTKVPPDIGDVGNEGASESLRKLNEEEQNG